MSGKKLFIVQTVFDLTRDGFIPHDVEDDIQHIQILPSLGDGDDKDDQKSPNFVALDNRQIAGIQLQMKEITETQAISQLCEISNCYRKKWMACMVFYFILTMCGNGSGDCECICFLDIEKWKNSMLCEIDIFCELLNEKHKNKWIFSHQRGFFQYDNKRYSGKLCVNHV